MNGSLPSEAIVGNWFTKGFIHASYVIKGGLLVCRPLRTSYLHAEGKEKSSLDLTSELSSYGVEKITLDRIIFNSTLHTDSSGLRRELGQWELFRKSQDAVLALENTAEGCFVDE